MKGKKNVAVFGQQFFLLDFFFFFKYAIYILKKKTKTSDVTCVERERQKYLFKNFYVDLNVFPWKKVQDGRIHDKGHFHFRVFFFYLIKSDSVKIEPTFTLSQFCKHFRKTQAQSE